MDLVNPITVSAAFVVVIVACAIAGRRQRRDAGASVGRLLWVSVVLAVGICAPLAVALAVPVEPWVALFGAYFGAVIVIKSLQPVGKLFSGGLELSRATDPELIGRVAELSERLGIRPPHLRVFGSFTPNLLTNAVAGGLVAPTMVVADGVLHRLPPMERDAILAHELGHVKRSTVWVYIALFLIAQIIATLTSTFTDGWVAGLFGVILALGLVKIVGHREEPAADRAAAQALGHGVAASALDKLHAAVTSHQGFWGALVHATQTHPSRAVRLAALRAAAPAEERAAIEVDEDEARWHGRASAVVFVVWVGLLAGLLALGTVPGMGWWAFAGLALVGLFPQLLLRGLQWRDHLERYRLGLQPISWGVIPIRLVFLGLAWLQYRQLERMEESGISPWIGLGVFMLLFVAGLLPWPGRERRVMRRVLAALGRHAFDEAVALYDELPRRLRRRAIHRRWRADALALSGDRAAAVAELEDVLAERPKENGARIGLAIILGPVDPAAALRQADAVEERVPGTHTVQVLRAALLRRLGGLDEARELLHTALERKPRLGQYHAAAARVEVSAGNLDDAEAMLEKAESLAPGDALVALVRAELALARGEPAAAREAFERADEAARKQPMMLLDVDVEALRARVDARAHH